MAARLHIPEAGAAMLAFDAYVASGTACMAELDALIAEHEPIPEQAPSPRAPIREKTHLEAVRELVSAGIPTGKLSPGRAQSDVQWAEALGRIDGLGDRHYAPELNFRNSAEWIAWLKGWRKGQQQLRNRKAAFRLQSMRRQREAVS